MINREIASPGFNGLTTDFVIEELINMGVYSFDPSVRGKL